jgi:hypothetical protein
MHNKHEDALMKMERKINIWHAGSEKMNELAHVWTMWGYLDKIFTDF